MKNKALIVSSTVLGLLLACSETNPSKQTALPEQFSTSSSVSTSSSSTILSNDQTDQNPSSQSENSLQSLYRSLIFKTSKFESPIPDTKETLIDSVKEGDFLIRNFLVKATDVIPNVEDFGKNDDLLWPGQILDGDAFYQSKDYQPLPLLRAPIDLSLSLEATNAISANTLTTTVESPKLSTIREGIRNLVNLNLKTETPAEYSYSYETIHSEEQLQLGMKSILAPSLLSSILNIDWKNSSVRTRLVFTFKQRAFSVDVDTPDSVFSSSNSEQELKELLTTTYSPLYVSSVDYGSAFYMVVESELEHQQLIASLNLGSSAFQGSNAINNENTIIRVAQFGGNTEMHTQITEAIFLGGGIPDIEGLLKNQTVESVKAVPIAYQLRYLKDHSIADVVLASEYNKKVYLKINQEVKATLTAFDFQDSDGAGGPEGSSSLEFIAIYKDSSQNVQMKNIGTWYGGVTDINPNKSYTFKFENFDPDYDYIRVNVRVVEKDAFSDDVATGSATFKVEEWNGTEHPIQASGNGAASEFTVKFELMP